VHEREFVERILWDTESIVDAAIDASIEVLRVQGSMGAESRRRIGQNFAFVRSNPHNHLTILAPDERTTLLTFLPPLEFAVNMYDLDEGELSAEARLVAHNPLARTDEPDYRKRQMALVLAARLSSVSNSYHLRQEDLVVAFPQQHYARGMERYVVPVLRQTPTLPEKCQVF